MSVRADRVRVATYGKGNRKPIAGRRHAEYRRYLDCPNPNEAKRQCHSYQV
jgi:hypothetical protein